MDGTNKRALYSPQLLTQSAKLIWELHKHLAGILQVGLSAFTEKHQLAQSCQYTVIHNYGNPYEKWNIFVAWPHLWLKLGMVKPEIMLCETVLNLSMLLYYAISGNVTSRHRDRETVDLLKIETPNFIPPRARM